MRIDEKWIRAHLPESCADQPINCFSGEYLAGLTVMQEGERGGDDVVVYRAKDEEDLRYWQLEQVCTFIKEKDPPPKKLWRWYRHHAEDGKWLYVEHRQYDYNAIEDSRLRGFEHFLRISKFGLPADRWEKRVREHVKLMNYWYKTPHWDYDREKLRFIEISDSREHDGDGAEEPRPGSIIKIVEDAKKGTRAAAQYSEQDLKYAAEFREGVHREALDRVRRVYPNAAEIIDPYPVESYFEDVWEYPGRYYTYVAVPPESGGREKLIDAIVKETLAHLRSLDEYPARRNKAARDGTGTYTAEGHEREQALMNGDLTQEEYAAGMGDAGIDAAEREFGKRQKKAAPGPRDPFYELISQYPDCVIDYCIVAGEAAYQGYESHRTALDTACRTLLTYDEDGDKRRCNVKIAMGKQIDVEELFSSEYQKDKLNYRRAFLYPPHENGYTGKDFVKVNAVLFPNGTDALVVYEWTTDWSDYFDDGHEWWGTLCLTVYDPSLDRFVVILASATD